MSCSRTLNKASNCQGTRDELAHSWRWCWEDKKGPDSAGFRCLSKDLLIYYPTGNRRHSKDFKQRKYRVVDRIQLVFWKEQCGCIVESGLGHLKSRSWDISWNSQARGERNYNLNSDGGRKDEKSRKMRKIFQKQKQ